MQLPRFYFVPFVSSIIPLPFSIEKMNNWNPRKSIVCLAYIFWQLKFWCQCANCGSSICCSYMQLPGFYLALIVSSGSWAPIWKLKFELLSVSNLLKRFSFGVLVLFSLCCSSMQLLKIYSASELRFVATAATNQIIDINAITLIHCE